MKLDISKWLDLLYWNVCIDLSRKYNIQRQQKYDDYLHYVEPIKLVFVLQGLMSLLYEFIF